MENDDEGFISVGGYPMNLMNDKNKKELNEFREQVENGTVIPLFVLDGYDETHPYGRVHGHSFRARVWIEGEPELESNMIADLGLIAKECEKVKNLLDHNTLNNVDGLHNPTLEGLCVFIWEKLITKFTNLNKIEVQPILQRKEFLQIFSESQTIRLLLSMTLL